MIEPSLDAAIRSRVSRIPIMDGLSLRIDALDEGTCTGTLPTRPSFNGIFGSLHGGLLMTLADTMACFAVLTLTGENEAMATTDMNIRFLSPCATDAVAHARVIKLGRTICPVHVDLEDIHGKAVAVAQVTYMRLGPSPSS